MSLPSVSCVLPWGYGDKWINMAIRCFLSQNYTGALELIVLDNNEEMPSGGWVDDRIKYHHTTRKPLGQLRNEANALATGEIICHFDEDDWSAPNRVAVQVERLLWSGKAVTGFHAMFYYDTETGNTYRYHFSKAKHPPTVSALTKCIGRAGGISIRLQRRV